MPRFFEEVKEILETIPFGGGDSMIWSTFLITTVTLTVTLADLSLSNNGKTPASAGVLTIVYGGEREPHRLLSAPLALLANVIASLPAS